MKNRKTYLIADLVKILDVPRTTVNDWMIRYEQYIESEVRGHRRIYFDTSLEVLKDIAGMRDAGKTTSEILNELAGRHPMNADITLTPRQPQEENYPAIRESVLDVLLPVVERQREEIERLLVRQLQNMASDLHDAQRDAFEPVVKQQTDEIKRILTGKFHDMADNLHRVQLDANDLSKQNSRRILLVIALIFTIFVAMALSFAKLHDVLTDQQQNFSLTRESLNKTISENNALLVTETQKRRVNDGKQREALQNLLDTLERNNKISHKDITDLKAIISTQQKISNTLLEQGQAEKKLLQETFKNELQALLGKIDELAKQNAQQNLVAQKSLSAEQDILAKKQNEQIIELHKKISELCAQVEIMGRQRPITVRKQQQQQQEY